MHNNFFEPGGGGPRWERWLLAGLMGTTGLYLLGSLKPQSEEISYQDFVQNHLQKNDITMITLCEDKSGSTFKYRAQISTNEGKRMHLVLPQVENFLYKLDLAQREMGRDPNSFVPVKYGSAEEEERSPAINLMIGASFAMMMVLIYRSMHGKGGGTGTGGKSTPNKNTGGGFGGGLGDMMNMSKAGT